MTPDDYPRVRRLWEDHATETLTPDDSLHGVIAFLDRNPGLSVVVEDSDRLVATALCGDDGRAGYIRHLVVDPSHKDADLENAILSVCIIKLKDLGINECHLFSSEGHRALKWYNTPRREVAFDNTILAAPPPRLASA